MHIQPSEGPSRRHLYSIVSDGCSSARDTDLGARLLVRAAHCESDAFSQILTTLEADGGDYTGRVEEIWQDFVVRTAKRAARWADSMQMLEESLSATLLVACSGPQWCFTASYGDGAHVVSRMESGERLVEVCVVDFLANYPAYPLYEVDDKLSRQYAAVSGNERRSMYANSRGESEERIGGGASQVLCYQTSEVAFVAVASDGVGSFGSLPAPEVSMNLTNFKNFTGEFVKRRCARALEECAKAGMQPADDVSVGGVFVGYGRNA
jgi:hypothetical protein